MSVLYLDSKKSFKHLTSNHERLWLIFCGLPPLSPHMQREMEMPGDLCSPCGGSYLMGKLQLLCLFCQGNSEKELKVQSAPAGSGRRDTLWDYARDHLLAWLWNSDYCVTDYSIM